VAASTRLSLILGGLRATRKLSPRPLSFAKRASSDRFPGGPGLFPKVNFKLNDQVDLLLDTQL
jgi:hypothetical protein